MNDDFRLAAARQTFADAFGGAPDVVASSPGRVNLIGEHTDYNGGEVLPIAIDRRTVVALRPNGTGEWRAASTTEGTRGRFERPFERVGAWWDYVAGVAWALERAGTPSPGCDVAVWSDVPAGAGLSSSAALEVATAAALMALAGVAWALDGVGVRAPGCDVAVWSDVPAGAGLSSSAALEVAMAAAATALAGGERPLDELALLSQQAETQFVGVQSGIMDQFASALGRAGHALHVWCDTARYEQLPMTEAVLIVDTAVPRSLRGSAFNTRRAECDAALARLRELDPALPHLAAATPELLERAALPEPVASRARHVVGEIARVHTVVDALRAGSPPPGAALVASHESLRDLYECSSPELDWVVAHAMTGEGVRGARLTGAGWGGCAIAVGAEDALAAAAPRLAHDFEARFGHAPRTWLTRAADGARVDLAPGAATA